MSVDRSLRVKSGALRSRSVLTRLERVEKLAHARRWKEGDPVLGLPKVRTLVKQKGKKKEAKKEAVPGAAAGTAPGAAAAAPAAPAKGAKK